MTPPTSHPAHFAHVRARSFVEQFPAPETIDLTFLRDDEFLFYGLAGCALLACRAQRGLRESVAAFHELPLVQRWLREHWYAAQGSHAETLARCVRHAWPRLEWETVFAASRRPRKPGSHEVTEGDTFDQLLLHSIDAVVLTCMYRAMAQHSHDEVLHDLLTRFAGEELRNVRFFQRYLAATGCESLESRLRMAWGIARRLVTISGCLQRIQLGLYRFRYGRAPVTRSDFRQLQRRIRPDLQRQFPYAEAAELLVSPLALPDACYRPIAWSTSTFLRYLF
jgi:hypothetical protein